MIESINLYTRRKRSRCDKPSKRGSQRIKRSMVSFFQRWPPSDSSWWSGWPPSHHLMPKTRRLFHVSGTKYATVPLYSLPATGFPIPTRTAARYSLLMVKMAIVGGENSRSRATSRAIAGASAAAASGTGEGVIRLIAARVCDGDGDGPGVPDRARRRGVACRGEDCGLLVLYQSRGSLTYWHAHAGRLGQGLLEEGLIARGTLGTHNTALSCSLLGLRTVRLRFVECRATIVADPDVWAGRTKAVSWTLAPFTTEALVGGHGKEVG
jgi:hypothetical protein